MIENFLSENNCIISNKIVKPNVIPPISPYIIFADPVVKQICVENWGSNGEITYEQAAAVKDLNGAFDYWGNHPPTEQITSFNELQYFTGLTSLGLDVDGNSSFNGATQLTSIILPNSLLSIGDYCFSECGLTSIVIPDSVTSIGEGAFEDCQGLTSLNIPNSISYIGGDAFRNTLYYDNMPDGLIYINNILYKYKGEMPSNTTIDVLSGTIGISGRAFYNMGTNTDELIAINIPNSVLFIGNYAFYHCWRLASITIPNSVTFIGENAFAICYSLSSISLGNGITTIKNSTFDNCLGISSIIIPDSILTIESFAFARCNNLSSITIGNSVTSIERYAFGQLGNNISRIITIKAIIPPQCNEEQFAGSYKITNIYVPAESVEAYKIAAGWSIYADIISAIVK